ncbi:MAG TPA: PEGA domain-containing protein [Polyangiaceae bacterium]|nr:PEGA domain-containing protein [Polyangiaceae bacterium]
MRLRAIPALSVACLLGVVPRSVHAAPAADREPASPNSSSAPGAEATAEARRHFKLGIKLYQDTNYPGALAEFEAAYAAKPGPSSLQNVALCQKALFRYREAAATLEELLRAHGTELSEGETKAVTEAIHELRGLVGSIVVHVEPSEAKVTIDGRAVPPSELRTGVDVNVGEHTLIADLPGYARLLRVVRVASGQKQLPIELKLKATDGFLSVIASDPRAAIAIDGTTRAFREWHGGVKPDTEHLIQVFREGYESFESSVSVGLGKTLEVRADLGPRIDGAAAEVPAEKPGGMPAPPPPRVPRGYYGLLTLGLMGLGQQPLQLNGTRSGSTMGTIGLRAGYRLLAPVAAEFMLDYGKLTVKNATSNDDTSVPRAYSLNALRFGPNLRLMTTGKTLRFTSAIGAGAVYHQLILDPVATVPSLTGGRTSGFDPYFLLELGAQWSLGHFLLGAEVVALIDGATRLNDQNIEAASKAFPNTNTLPLFGLAIHGGYSLW